MDPDQSAKSPPPYGYAPPQNLQAQPVMPQVPPGSVPPQAPYPPLAGHRGMPIILSYAFMKTKIFE